ncbi:MAG: CO2 hydration protein, partial [Aphanizomenon sp.]
MMTTTKNPAYNPLAEYIHRLQTGETLLKDNPENVLEVVGILKSYGVVLDAYSKNLIYIAEHQFLVFFPFFKYFNGDISLAKLLRHLWHDRINFEYAEYCLKAMMWHGGGGLDAYLDTQEFQDRAKTVIAAKFKYNPLLLGLNQLFPEFLTEQLRVSAYYTGLGQFWR